MQDQNQDQIEFGTVVFYSRQKGFGYLTLEMLDGDVRIEKCTGPVFIDAGVDTPVFTGEHIKTLPVSGDRVAFIRGEGREMLTAVCWSYAALYIDVAKKIAGRQQFRVLRRTCLHGSFGDWREVITGTAVKLASISTRDGQRVSSSDEFASTFWNGKLVTENRFQIWKGGRGYVDYAIDPRPFPKSDTLYRATMFENGEPHQLDFGTVEEIMWKHPRGIKGDKLAPTDPKSVHRLLYWECRKENSKDDWTLCEDPRRIPFQLPVEVCKSVEAVVSVSSPATPVAMPKKNKPKDVLLKDLSALTEVVGNFVH